MESSAKIELDHDIHSQDQSQVKNLVSQSSLKEAAPAKAGEQMEVQHNEIYKKVEKDWDKDRIIVEEIQYVEDKNIDNDGVYWGYINKDEQRHGPGTFKFVDGRVYNGEWSNDKPNGYG